MAYSGKLLWTDEEKVSMISTFTVDQIFNFAVFIYSKLMHKNKDFSSYSNDIEWRQLLLLNNVSKWAQSLNLSMKSQNISYSTVCQQLLPFNIIGFPQNETHIALK